jgi:hypothetical protein
MGNSVRASSSFGYFVAQFFPAEQLPAGGYELMA